MRDAARPDPAGPTRLARGAWLLAAAAIGGVASVWHVTGQTVVSLEKLAAFQETAPFQHRVLVPGIVHIASTITGGPFLILYLVAEWLGWLLLFGAAVRLIERLQPRLGWATTRLAAMTSLVSVGAQLMAPVRFRAYNGDTVIGDVNGLLHGATSLRALPHIFYPWDVWSAALLLALVAGLLGLRERVTAPGLAAYAVVFVVSAMNRETTILLVPFALWALAPRLTRAQLVAAGVAQIAVWLIVRAAIVWMTQAAPNPKTTMPGGVEWYLWTNMRTLTYPLYVITVLVPFAGGAWLPIVAWWSSRPALARALLLLYVAPAAALAVVFGIVHETRVFTEAAAATWLAAAATLHAQATDSLHLDHA